MDLVGEKILNVLTDSLSIEDLEALIEKKRHKSTSDTQPKIMTERERLKAHYRKLLLSSGKFYPPKNK